MTKGYVKRSQKRNITQAILNIRKMQIKIIIKSYFCL